MTNNTEPLDASVTLEEIFSVVAQKRAPLAPELAGYLVLELSETLGAERKDSSSAGALEIDPRYVYVSEEGSVALVRGPQEASGDPEGALRRLLTKLLETAGAQTPALASVARRKGGAGVGVLVEELEAALIPVNRSAGKRALARLARETKRVTNRVGRNASIGDAAVPQAAIKFAEEEIPTTTRRDVPADVMEAASPSLQKPAPLPYTPPPTPVAPAPSPDESQSDLPTVGISKEDLEAAQFRTKRDSVDSLLDSFEASGALGEKALSKELKAMAGLEPTPPPPKSMDDIESLLAQSPVSTRASASDLRKDTGRESPAARRSQPPPKKPVDEPEPEPAAAVSQRARDPMPSFAAERQLPTAPSQVKKMSVSISSEAMRPKKSGGGIGMLVVFVFVLAGFAVALWLLKPGFLTGRTPEKIAEERRAAEAESARIAAQRAVPACHATLIVTGAPKDAEILIREGQAPVDVEHLPVGTRLEFVATAEGFAPKRTVVAADATWDSASGKPRFDLPVQLDKSKAKPNAVDPWPPGEMNTEIGGKGNPGTVHIISSPKGAEVWLLAGIGGPDDANIEDIVTCDKDIDVLVAGPTTYRKKLHVAASSFTADPSGKVGVRVAHLSVK